MFNPKYIVPIEMFSFQHFAALAVIAALFLAVFLSRTFFMKHKTADMIFRYSLATLIIGAEMGYYFYAGYAFKASLAEMLPTYLCGHLLWIVSIALYANSQRIIKLFAPIAMTGGLLSMIFVNMEASFPHFRAFHYFIIHAGFVLGVLYFFFTKKIAHFNLKDFGRSSFTLLGMASFIFILNGFHFGDYYFLIDPPDKSLQFIKTSFGQSTYTFLFILSIGLIMTVQYLLLSFFTKHRTEREGRLPTFKKSKFLNHLSKLSFEKRISLIFVPLFFFVFLTVLQKMNGSKIMFFLDLGLLLFIVTSVILNEISLNYRSSFKK